MKPQRAQPHTYLAEASIQAIFQRRSRKATAAIEETDSILARSWLVCASAHHIRGDIDAAAEDYNRALWAADELGTEELALAGLREIDRPVSDSDFE